MQNHTSDIVEDAANTLLIIGRKAVVYDTSTSVLKDAENLVSGRRRGKKNSRCKGKKYARRKRRKKKYYKPNIARAAMFIGDEIPDDLDVQSIHVLLGECLLYESLFIWQADATEEYMTEFPPAMSTVFAIMLQAIHSNHRKLVKLLLELPKLRALRHYDEVLKSGDVADLALMKAEGFVLLHLRTIRKFESIDEIAAYCEANIETCYIPKGEIAQPIISTFCKCFNIVSVEDDNSS